MRSRPIEGVRPAADLAERETLGLGALVVAAVSKPAPLSELNSAGQLRGGDLLERVAASRRRASAGLRPDRERAGAEGVERLVTRSASVLPSAVGDGEPAERREVVRSRAAAASRRRASRVRAETRDSSAKPGPVPGVALVRRDEVRVALGRVGGDAVRLVHAEDGPVHDLLATGVADAVAVARVEAVARRRWSLKPSGRTAVKSAFAMSSSAIALFSCSVTQAVRESCRRRCTPARGPGRPSRPARRCGRRPGSTTPPKDAVRTWACVSFLRPFGGR